MQLGYDTSLDVRDGWDAARFSVDQESVRDLQSLGWLHMAQELIKFVVSPSNGIHYGIYLIYSQNAV